MSRRSSSNAIPPFLIKKGQTFTTHVVEAARCSHPGLQWGAYDDWGQQFAWEVLFSMGSRQRHVACLRLKSTVTDPGHSFDEWPALKSHSESVPAKMIRLHAEYQTRRCDAYAI